MHPLPNWRSQGLIYGHPHFFDPVLNQPGAKAKSILPSSVAHGFTVVRDQLLVVANRLGGGGFFVPAASDPVAIDQLANALLARRLGISRATVNSIRRGDSWSHI